ncbi:hypothetical protein BG004_007695 [Podila humilis]|nr:hypothetical protein BG004_007695 [Podila humilis]
MVKKSIKFPSMGPKNNPHRHYGLPLFFRPRPASSSLIECGRADSQEEQVVVEEILTVDPPRPRPNNDSLDCETIHPSLDSDSRHTCPQPLSLLEEFHSDSSSTLILQQSFLTDSDNDMDMDMDKNNDENQSSPGLPFHGLPPEMVQYIARFFSFRTLVLVYKSFPGVHRPILQQMLDHSLALMILTLEIRQFQDVEYLVPVHHNRDRATQNHNNNNNNNNNNNTIAPPLPGAYTISAQAQASMEEETTTTLSTQWRATEFDLDQWTVKFQLEEKLGLEVEAKRRQLLRLQQQQQPQQRENQNLGQIQLKEMNNDSGTSSSSSTTNNSNRNINHNRNSDIASDVAVAVTEDDIENLIWQARSRYSSGRVSPESPTLLAMGTEITPETGVPTGAHSIVTTAAIAATSNNMEESNTATTETASSTTTPFLSVLHDQFDNNFFHCNGSAYPPILSSAKISFKALRNTPAPWISQRIEHLGPHHHYQHPEVSIPTMTFNSSTNDGKDSTYCQLVHNTENNNNSMTAVRSNQAIERIASYQQNQMLQRSLAKMVEYNNHNRNHNQSSGIHQFLHTQVELETGDLGQRLVKSFLLPPTPDSTPGYRGPKQDATTLSID